MASLKCPRCDNEERSEIYVCPTCHIGQCDKCGHLWKTDVRDREPFTFTEIHFDRARFFEAISDVEESVRKILPTHDILIVDEVAKISTKEEEDDRTVS